MKQVKQSVEVVQSCDLPDNAKIAIAQMTRTMALMSNAIYDMKSTNNDLLQLSVGQYKSSLDQRKEAWVNSARLPIGLKRELKQSNHVKPHQANPHDQPLAMLDENAIKMLDDQQQMLRDQAVMGRSFNDQSFPQNSGQKQDRGRPVGRRGGGRGHNQQPQHSQYNSYNSYRGNRGGYRGQNPRAGYRGTQRGRGNFNQPQPQPFSDTQSRTKRD